MISASKQGARCRTEKRSNVFEFLRAEDEGAWLHDAFVAPDGFSDLLRPRSVLVLGSAGSGKSTLRREIRHRAKAQQDAPLVVDWRLSLHQFDAALSSATSQQVARQLLEAACTELLRQIATTPIQYQRAERWVHETVADLVSTFVHPRTRMVRRLESMSTPEGAIVLRSLLEREPGESGNEDSLPWMAELSDLLTELGWNGLWIILDGFETWLNTEEDRLTAVLRAFLDNLGQFEIKGLSLKIFAPEELGAILLQCNALQRRRTDVYRIAWRTEQLQALVEERLALVTGTQCRLEDLCEAPDWPKWLREHIGRTPRDWLAVTRSLLDQYLDQEERKPLSPEIWWGTRADWLPTLHMDLVRKRVYLGERLIAEITPTEYKLLCYLYTHPLRLCNRQELYYRGYLGLDTIPARKDNDWYPEWRGWTDTNIGRLRRAIEPDPSDPVYIVTERGKGVALRNAR